MNGSSDLGLNHCAYHVAIIANHPVIQHLSSSVKKANLFFFADIFLISKCFLGVLDGGCLVDS